MKKQNSFTIQSKLTAVIWGLFFSLFFLNANAAQLGLADNPLFLTSSTTPISMLNISKDHQLYFKAFDDYSDLDNDGTPETSYKHSFDYYGYFDSYKCYTYNTTNQRFEPSSTNTNKYCTSSWSGNFLNWASMSRVDTIRKILYGGLRSTDTGNTTSNTSNTSPAVTSSATPIGTPVGPTAYVLTSTDSGTTNNGTRTTGPSNVLCSTLPYSTTESAKSLESGFSAAQSGTTIDGTPTDSTPTSSTPVITTTESPIGTTTKTTFTTSYTSTFDRTASTFKTTTQTTTYSNITRNSRTSGGSTDTRSDDYCSTYSTPVTKTYTNTYTSTTTTQYQSTTSSTTTSTSGPVEGLTVLERSYLPNDAHSFAKFYAGSDLTQLTPFSSTEVASGITLCNTTVSSTQLSQNVTSNPLIRVAKGNYSLWASNERWQCRWSEEKAASNGNVSASSGISAQSSNPSKSTNGAGSQDYVARVRVCNASYIGTENCKTYADGTRKPIGLLQTYGDDDRLRFGLLTGSYGKNKSGGVLRKNVSSIADEINIDTNGTFKTAPTTGAIINSLNKMRIYGYRHDDGTYFGVSNSADCIWGLNTFSNGDCNNWGNPQSEILLESLRYLAGETASTSFNVDDTSFISGLTRATPADPVIAAQWCATQNVIQFNASTSSYDGDELSSVTDLGATGMNALTNVVGVGENIPGNSFFVGENGTDNNQLCTAKTVTNLSDVLGTCPDAPRLSGSYHVAGLAHYAHTNDIRSDIQGKQLVTTYGVALSPQVPKIEIPVPSTSKKITILPACQNTDIGGNCAIVDFKIVSQTSTSTKNSGKLYVNWEDSEQGGDFDQDEWGVLDYEVTSTTAKITTRVIAESTIYNMGFGYVIGGTTKDGFHAHSGIEGYAYTDPQGVTSCSNCNVGDAATAVTYTIGSSSGASLEQPLFYAAKWGGFIDANGDNKPLVTSEWDSKPDGHPDAKPDRYFFATDPKNLETSLKAAFDDVVKRTSSAASAAANSTSIQSGTMLYQAQFNSTDWSGHIFNFPVNSSGAVVDVNADDKLDGIDANWDAGLLIPTSSRNIFTYNDSVGTTFFWDNLSASQQTLLQTDSIGSVGSVTQGQNRLLWIRGDRSQESPNGLLRARTSSLLGDVINSDPNYTKTEDFGYAGLPSTTSGQSTYAQFVTDKTSGTTPRIPMIYVGANDGMLHGFRADIGNSNSGREILAYVPAGVYSNLSRLSEIDYAHTYFVDGSPTIGDAYLSGSWKTVLVGGLNKGGKSIYALNISNPAAFTPSTDVLWEYRGGTTDTGAVGTTDANGMGLTYSQPQIGLLKDGTWAAIFGNGYNSSSEKAFLYIVNLSTGELIKKIPTNASTSNGLSTPKLHDSDGDKIIDAVYAGDLQGNMWKFDLSATAPTGWSLGNGGNPLFTATRTTGIAQPITAQPVIGAHPDGGVLVFFGTGRYLTGPDVTNLEVQSFYAIWDKPSSSTTVLRSSLVQQSITEEIVSTRSNCTDDTATPANECLITYARENCTDDTLTPVNECAVTYPYSLRGTSSATVDYTSKRGWYMDLLPLSGTAAGERVISSALLKLDRIIFLTAIPSTDPCSPGGTSWLMEVDFKTGGATAVSSFDLNNDDKFDAKDTLPSNNTASGVLSNVGMIKSLVWLDKEGTDVAVKEGSGTSSNIQSIKNKGAAVSSGTASRLYWLQIQ